MLRDFPSEVSPSEKTYDYFDRINSLEKMMICAKKSDVTNDNCASTENNVSLIDVLKLAKQQEQIQDYE
ncbi:hypothetical protein PFDG_05256 [Plasmodium falciparum Dd2]|uniref:Uncharacterized protein n=1 Tax=Plasmodium falciparum (isolate Dd2) TaxID=57267 RepID=A0A0L7MA71_PLAF4|nr:hypothetical protein PFDG_05256 [Plasmodium falciparum Dd2]